MSPQSPASGLFAAWAGAELISQRLPDERAFASVLAGDRDAGVIVVEDLGRGTALDHLLENATAAVLADAFDDLARVLAAMHGATLGQFDRFAAIHSRMGPMPDDQSRQRYWAEALSVLDTLGVTRTRHAAALEEIEAAGLTDGGWPGLRHTEPGFDNVRLVDGRIVLVDFEGSLWGNVLHDVAFPAMAFGHMPSTSAVPEAVVQRFEDRYFDHLRKTHPDLAVRGPAELPAAKAWLAMEFLGGSFSHFESEKWAPWGGARARAQAVSQWRVVRNQPGFARLAEDVLRGLATRWQTADPPALPIAPGFAR